MKFSDVLTGLEQGRKFRRRLWEVLGPGWLELLHFGDHQGVPVQPLLMICRQRQDGWIWYPFSGANWDLLADDWEEVL